MTDEMQDSHVKVYRITLRLLEIMSTHKECRELSFEDLGITKEMQYQVDENN